MRPPALGSALGAAPSFVPNNHFNSYPSRPPIEQARLELDLLTSLKIIMFEDRGHAVNDASGEPRPPGLIPLVSHNRANLSGGLLPCLRLHPKTLRNLKRQIKGRGRFIFVDRGGCLTATICASRDTHLQRALLSEIRSIAD